MQGALKGIIREGDYREPFLDWMSHNQVIQGELHNAIHNGICYEVAYSVVSLGAMADPDDMITLTFTTPDTTDLLHWIFAVDGTAGDRVRMIEAPTGGATSPTGTLPILNKYRASLQTSGIAALYYDATLATGGTTIIDQYLTGNTRGIAASGNAGGRDEWVLKKNTTYQISLYGTNTNPATISMLWYEYTPNN